MFEAKKEVQIKVSNIPLQWIPKVEIYYPDLPQFPIMYIHTHLESGERLFAFPVSVSFDIKDDYCDASFCVLCNRDDEESKVKIQSEIKERIGLSDLVTKAVALACCKGNKAYENFINDIWEYVSMSYGDSIPYGQFFEEIYSIARFVSAWQPKTGRQSEMRMLYNFMSAFGEAVNVPKNWKHLECYLTPTLRDVQGKKLNEFYKFNLLDSAMRKTYAHEYNKTVSIQGVDFKVMPKAWANNKDDFMNDVSLPLYDNGVLNEDERGCLEKLVDAFNRHPWRAAYYISSYMTIDHNYYSWTKDFFAEVYIKGNKLKGYSEKVIACFLQQGFKNKEVIPVDTWIETFYEYSLGIKTIKEFYDTFVDLGKFERLIWLASQANKTNMKNFFDLLWCQRYGTIGNGKLRGINPIACSECKLNGTCVGLKKNYDKNILLINGQLEYELFNDVLILPNTINTESLDFVCLFENKVPKKVFVKEIVRKKPTNRWLLTDEFSGYILDNRHQISEELLEKEVVPMKEYMEYYKKLSV
jgi:hypothetical protein